MNILNKKTYNNQEYDVTLFLYRASVTMTTPAAIETEDKDAFLIPSEDITYMMFENSMVDIIPKAEFEIIDNRIFTYIKIKKRKFKI